MTAASCPSCGVPVVPGYARCPKCHAALPRRPATTVEGGTALEQPRRVPLPAVIGAGAVGLGLIIWLGVRGSHAGKPAAKPAPPPPAPAATTTAVTLAPGAPPPSTQPAAPNPDAVAAELERTLKRQRLWATVTVTGSRVEVRSGSCSDQAIQAPIGAAAPALKAAGLTSLRCVEESGTVVFTRQL